MYERLAIMSHVTRKAQLQSIKRHIIENEKNCHKEMENVLNLI